MYSKPTRIPRRALQALLFAVLAGRAWAPTAAQLITFEEPIPAPENVRTQYCIDPAQNQGVEFATAVRIFVPEDLDGNAVETSSPTHAALHREPQEPFTPTPLVIRFTAGQSRVGVRVGPRPASLSPVRVVLRAFDDPILGVKLTPDPDPSVLLEPGPLPITSLLEFETEDGTETIRRLEIEATGVENGIIEREIIDDLSFSTVGPPCLTDNDAPQVDILEPVFGQTVANPQISLRYTATDDVGLATVRISMLDAAQSELGAFTSSPRSASFFTFLPDGTARIRVVATDFSGKVGSDEVAINFALPEPDLNLWALGMEVTQALQDHVPVSTVRRARFAARAVLESQIPLVSGKRTVVRVYPGVEGTTVPVVGARASLHCFTVLGRNLGSGVRCRGPLGADAFNPEITVDPAHGNDLTTLRSNPELSWNFLLPDEWTAPGERRFLVAVINSPTGIPECGRGTADDCDDGANFFVLELRPPAFHETGPLLVQPIYACVRRSQGVPTTQCDTLANDAPTATALAQSILWSNDWDGDGIEEPLNNLIYPVAELSAGIRIAPPILNERVDGDLGTTNGIMSYDRMSALLGQICQREDLDRLTNLFPSAPGRRVSLALLRPPTGPAGIAKLTKPCSVAKFDFDASRVADNDYCRDCAGDSSWPIHYDVLTVSHEIGHTFDITHAGCDHGEGSGGGCEPVPCPHGGICVSSLDQDQPFIFDTFRMRAFPPRTDSKHAHDMMSYGPEPTWISAHTYRRLFFKLLEARADTLSAPGQKVAGLFVAGRVEQPGDKVFFDSVFRLSSISSELVASEGSGSMSLTLKKELGETLFTRRFDPTESSSDKPGQSDAFSEVLPDLDAAHELILKRGDLVLAERMRSAHAPTLELLSPTAGDIWQGGSRLITWTASDADGDPVDSTLQYSPDGGKSWHTLAMGRPEASLEVETDLLSGSGPEGARIRIIASDGWNSSTAESEPFRVSPKAPSARILSPPTGAIFQRGELVVLRGGALDIDDGTLPSQALAWSSSLDGPLGVGSEVRLKTLSRGVHTITLTARDSDSQTGEARIELTIEAGQNNQPIADAGEDQAVAIGSRVQLDGRGSSDADQDPLTFTWRVVSSTEVLLFDTATSSPGFLASRAGRYELELVVSDGQVDSFPDTVVITAEEAPTEPPRASHADSFGIALGMTLPAGSANGDLDSGPAASMRYQWTLRGPWSLSGGFGYSALEGDDSADLGLWDLGLAARWDSRPRGAARFFFQGGVRYYAPEDDFGAGDPGLNLGAGLALPLGRAAEGAELEIRLEGHKLFPDEGQDRDFLRSFVGLTVRR